MDAQANSTPPPTPAVVTPVRRLDPLIGLATAVHSAPGVYALLLGSGVSSSASILTGWQIVTDLVRRAATAAEPDQPVLDGPSFDPEQWWTEHGDGGDLGYSSVLTALAPTPAGRDALLRTYFEATDEDRLEGRKLPTAAHQAIAELVAAGFIRVILTTNFDRLLERALEQRGIQPQVIHQSDQIAAMTPLVHVAVTLIKLHGDYSDLDKRNTVDELSIYSLEQDGLLRRILDEYGLIISGWSGEWDRAIVRALEETKPRRYPLFWSSFRQPSEAGRRLIAQLSGISIEDIGADDLFVGLQQRLDALRRLSAPPLSRELAVVRLKRYLPNPIHRIDAYDLVLAEVSRIEALARDRHRYPMHLPTVTNEQFCNELDKYVTQYRDDSDTLLHLLAAGAYFSGSEHTSLWSTVVQSLVRIQTSPSPYIQYLLDLSEYPCLLASYSLLACRALTDKYDLAGPVLRTPRIFRPTMYKERTAAYLVHPWHVFSNNFANKLPRWGGKQYHFPASKLLRADLDDVLSVYEPDVARRTEAIDMAEYLNGLACIADGDSAYYGENALRGRNGQLPLAAAKAIRAGLGGTARVLVDDLFAGDEGAAVTALDRLDQDIAEAAQRSLWG